MKVEVKNIHSSEKELHIEVPKELLKTKYSQLFKEVYSKAKIPGFRQGKVPPALIEKQYGAKITADAGKAVLEDTMVKALEDNKIFPLSPPSVTHYDTQGDCLSYSMKVEVSPEISLNQYKGIKLEKVNKEVSEEEIQNVLKSLQNSKAEIVPVLEMRHPKEDDFIVIDYELQIAGNAVGKETGYLVQLGANTLFPDIEKCLMSMNIGEVREINFSLPENFHDPKFANKAAHSKVTLREIKKKILPELNDTFAKTIHENYSFEKLKEEIKKDLELKFEQESKEALDQQLILKLIELNPFTPPKSWVDKQSNFLREDTKTRMAKSGYKDFEQIEKTYPFNFSDKAEKQVKTTFLMDKIADIEKISITDEDIEKNLIVMSQKMNYKIEELRKYYSEKSHMNMLKWQLKEEKVLDFLVKNSEIIEKK